MALHKLVPQTLMSIRGESAVSRVEAFPPGKHPEGLPILKDLTAVIVTLANGTKRYYGFTSAMIGSDLRMHVGGINPRDEVLAKWEDCDCPSWDVHEGRPSWHQQCAGHISAAVTSGFASEAEAQAYVDRLKTHHPEIPTFIVKHRS